MQAHRFTLIDEVSRAIASLNPASWSEVSYEVGALAYVLMSVTPHYTALTHTDELDTVVGTFGDAPVTLRDRRDDFRVHVRDKFVDIDVHWQDHWKAPWR